jgi:serine/threonine protein kinase/tetratricopeptide (TPR) repeat protein
MSMRAEDQQVDPNATIRTTLQGSPADFARQRSLKRELLREQQAAWDSGCPAAPEDLLRRWPTDPQTDPDAVSILLGDLMQRRLHGEAPSVQEYATRFPLHHQSLDRVLTYHERLGADTGPSDGIHWDLRLPEAGEEVFGFRLCRELGRGAFARVFQAEQADLAGRPVVLKVSAIEGTEPQTLAQLQHTHIVPIYSVHEDLRAGLRAVCMPYFGGASLSSVLTGLWAECALPQRGRELVAALERIQAPPPAAVRAPGPTTAESGAGGDRTALHALAALSYLRTCAWMVARLAEGLQHAHQRGVLHRDIKPSNILVSADGLPLLLDFNLAQDTNTPAALATLGGTIAYMAPEHLRAFLERRPAAVRSVDRRSDLYSLGMVLYEMVTSRSPFDQSASYTAVRLQVEAMAVERSRVVPSLRQARTDVPWGLESIARKCLAPDPDQRYQEAEHLAEDLRRFLEDRPLRHAPELSRVERLQKWVRRHPRWTSSGTVAAAAALLLVVAGFALAGVRDHLAAAQDQLLTARAVERKQQYQAGTVRALCLVNTTLDMQDQLRQGVAVCEETLALYGVLEDDAWQDRSAWDRLDLDDRRLLAEDTRELLLSLAGARVRLAPGDRAVLRQALTLLDRAEAIAGLEPSRAIWLERAHYLGQLGETDQARAAKARAEQIVPASARDHYLLATAYARGGGPDGYRKALAELQEALRLNPRHYWSWVQKGICHQELGEYVAAALAFGNCTGLWPEFAWGYFNRGVVLDQSGARAEAIAEYTTALERDADFVPAYVNRGLAALELKRYDQALADFDQALGRGRDDALLHAGRGAALEALGRHGEADAAFGEAFARAATLPAEARLRLRWTYGFAVARRLPDKARAAFQGVLRQDPRHPQALYGCAMLTMADHPAEALGFFNRAVEAAPDFVEARRYRAILRARMGDADGSARDINWCLERGTDRGATLYAAACVAARLSDPGAAEQTLNFLRQAQAQGWSLDQAGQDPDLAVLHGRPEFQRLLAKVGAAPKLSEPEASAKKPSSLR